MDMLHDPLGNFMRTPIGAIAAQPWFDQLALHMLGRHYLRLSRAWAAAVAAGGSVDRFLDGVPIADASPSLRGRAETVLAAVERARASAGRAEERWQAAAFGASRGEDVDLVRIERARLAASHRLMAMRMRFQFLQRECDYAIVRYAVPTPGEMEQRYGALLATPEQAYEAPLDIEIEHSGRCALRKGAGRSWLRFRSPSTAMDDVVYARIDEPADATDAPTLIFGHGLCVENEQWRPILDAPMVLLDAGVRIIQLNAPWHGRRVPAGYYGGERFLAGAPMSVFELLCAQARETAAVIAWCRRTGRAPVAVGGISMGALVAQLVAVHARHWPAEMRPDALLLATTCGRLDHVAFNGSLSRELGLSQAMTEAGWSPEILARWRPLTDPVGAPALDPADMVMMLGRADRVTPFALGRELAAEWSIPEGNLFIRRQGHFSAALGELRDTSHFMRLRDILFAKMRAGAFPG